MLIRRASWLLSIVLACTPAPAPPSAPDAPVLEGDGTIKYDFRWTLTGTAPSGTVVRVYLDETCTGPALLDVTPAQLAEGVHIELAAGTPNVFSALSIDERGVFSVCSAPIHVSFERPPRPRTPQARITPPLPTHDTHFSIAGSAQDAVSVQLFENSCFGMPLGELSVQAFSEVGFQIDILPNQTRRFVLNALNVLGEASACSTDLIAASDWLPPVVHPELLSPYPSPELSAYVALSVEAASGEVFLGSDCTGPVLATCTGYDCAGFPVTFPASPTSAWSAKAQDSLENESDCVNATPPWQWDPLAPAPPLSFNAYPQQWLRGLVPASSKWVEIFDGPACGDPEHLRARMPAVKLAGPGFYTYQFGTASDGGVLVAWGLSELGSPSTPCTAPVPWF